MNSIAGAVLGGLLGVAAGWSGRLLLGRAAVATPLRPGYCEVVTGALAAVVAWRACAGALPGQWCAVAAVLTALAGPLIVADLRYRRLPDILTLPAYPAIGVAIAAAASGAGGSALAVRACVGAVLFGLVHATVHLLVPRALGAGDVKLSGSLGAVLGALGWSALAFAAVLAAVISMVLALTAAMCRSGRWAAGVPHGPGMLTATWMLAVFPAGFG